MEATPQSSPPALVLRRSEYDAVIFDLDGVITDTARVHARAWKSTFDAYLEQRNRRHGERNAPFDADADYRAYVDGKPRYEGVRSFLESRGIALPWGDPGDPPERETVCGLGNRKNALFGEELSKGGVDVFESTVSLVHTLREHGYKTAVVSSSRNCVPILESAGLMALFDTKVDGTDADSRELRGKPAPDYFWRAAMNLDVSTGRAVVVEDAVSGVQAGRAGHFGCVLGVDRVGQPQALHENGADIVVADLSEVAVAEAQSDLATSTPTVEVDSGTLPSVWAAHGGLAERLEGRRPAVFLDYDGTLTPIVARPDQAVLSETARNTVRRLAELCPVAVISGRDLPDVRALVGLDGIYYAGSHGFDIAGPAGTREARQEGGAFLPALDEAERWLHGRLALVPGVLVERKRFSIAIHYRGVQPEMHEEVARAVAEAVHRFDRLRRSTGKMVYELQPKLDWDKGKAVYHVLRALKLDRPDVLPIYVGDDTTDEDAFRALKGYGVGVLVADETRRTRADYRLRDPAEVQRLLDSLIGMLDGEGT